MHPFYLSLIISLLGLSTFAARATDSIPKTRQTHLSIGLGNIQFQDRATSPLVYNGIHLNLLVGQSFIRPKQEVGYTFELGAGALISRAPKQILNTNALAYIGTTQIGLHYLHQLPLSSAQQWSLFVGGKLDAFFDLRINPSLENATLAYDGLFNLMLASKAQYKWYKTTKRGKHRNYSVFVKFNAGLLNINYRPGYNTISLSPLINNTKGGDYEKDKSVSYAAKVNGYRFHVELGLLRSNAFSRSNQISYVFEGAYAPGRYEPYGILFHRLKYTLTLQKTKR